MRATCPPISPDVVIVKVWLLSLWGYRNTNNYLKSDCIRPDSYQFTVSDLMQMLSQCVAAADEVLCRNVVSIEDHFIAYCRCREAVRSLGSCWSIAVWQRYARKCKPPVLWLYRNTLRPPLWCGLLVRIPGYRSRYPGFDFRPYQIFWEVVGLERGPFSLGRIIEEVLGRKSSGSDPENWD
jgi:hypothetical protein